MATGLPRPQPSAFVCCALSRCLASRATVRREGWKVVSCSWQGRLIEGDGSCGAFVVLFVDVLLRIDDRTTLHLRFDPWFVSFARVKRDTEALHAVRRGTFHPTCRWRVPPHTGVWWHVSCILLLVQIDRVRGSCAPITRSIPSSLVGVSPAVPACHVTRARRRHNLAFDVRPSRRATERT